MTEAFVVRVVLIDPPDYPSDHLEAEVGYVVQEAITERFGSASIETKWVAP